MEKMAEFLNRHLYENSTNKSRFIDRKDSVAFKGDLPWKRFLLVVFEMRYDGVTWRMYLVSQSGLLHSQSNGHRKKIGSQNRPITKVYSSYIESPYFYGTNSINIWPPIAI